MAERKLRLPDPERMTERHCRLAGYIGLVGVMKGLGELYEAGVLLPSSNPQVMQFRPMCSRIHTGKFIDVEADLQRACASEQYYGGQSNHDMRIAAQQAGLLRNMNGYAVIDPYAQFALQYHAGSIGATIHPRTRERLDEVTSFVLCETKRNIADSIAVDRDDSSHEIELARYARGEISYYIKSD